VTPPPRGTAPGQCVLLEGAYVLTLDDDDTRGALSIAVRDGDIAAIGERRELRAAFPAAHRVACRERIIMPGLVNAHLHPDLHVLKGELEGLSLHDWPGAGRYNAAVEFLGTAAGAAVRQAAIRASLAEAVLGGTTCVGTYGVSHGADRACEGVLQEMGLRGTITVRDETFAPLPDTAGGTGWDRDVRALYRLHAEEALHAPELEAAARAHGRGEHIVMHAAETRTRLDIVRQRFGLTTVRLLDRHGLLSAATLLSHAIHVDAEEILLMARSGVNVVVSPAAEMKLSDGVAPVQEMHGHGITVALGTDAAVCNNGTDMFLEMRLLGLTQKLRYGAAAAPAEQILRMATRAGATVLGGAGRFGSLAPGMAADLILVGAAGPRMQPLVLHGPHSNLAPNLVYAATGADVTDVMVGGRWIVRRRRLQTLNERALRAQLDDAVATLQRHLQREP
jgi:5-methylthioadenosine/S-adenosylhomocysteine deaminase